MLADYFTKHLQGSLFRLFREIIMGYKHILVLLDKIPTKERVGQNDQKVSEIGSSNNDDVSSDVVKSKDRAMIKVKKRNFTKML
mmetsp:Transcript_3028/g.4265  ORF Transcript_3028/g.4265 Transcript_3028/m.4265 type:complete len:84 (+) Transcript_3028:291-542(+)